MHKTKPIVCMPTAHSVLLKPSRPKSLSVLCPSCLYIVQDWAYGSVVTILTMKVLVAILGLITATFLSGGRGLIRFSAKKNGKLRVSE